MGGGGFPRPRGGQAGADANGGRSIFIQLLPLFILFAISFLSSLPNLFATPPIPDPHYSFVGTARYSVPQHTDNLGITYHINAGEFMSHPAIGAELLRQGVDLRKSNTPVEKGKKGPAFTKFEQNVDHVYKDRLIRECRAGMDRKERLKEQEIGLFGIGTDWEKVKQISAEVVESCEELRRLGVIR
jgi:DnaJ homolog subfamily B member 12